MVDSGKCIAVGILVVLLVVVVVAITKRASGSENFLIYPYLDLDGASEYRGNPYALSQCAGWGH
jgi:hypothetical protein